MKQVFNEKGVSARWRPETIEKNGAMNRKAIRVGETFKLNYYV
jgi:hypothetical protein